MSLLEKARALLSYAEQWEDAELLQKVNDARMETFEYVDQLLELRFTVQELERELAAAREKLSLAGNLKYYRRMYFEQTEDGRLKPDPYCPHCWERNRVAVHLHYNEHAAITLCPNCTLMLEGSDYWTPDEPFSPEEYDGEESRATLR
jgi:hypothetical protein